MPTNRKSPVVVAIRTLLNAALVAVPIVGYIYRHKPGVTAICFVICLLTGLAWRSSLVTCTLIGAASGLASFFSFVPWVGSGLPGDKGRDLAVRVLVGTGVGLLVGCAFDPTVRHSWDITDRRDKRWGPIGILREAFRANPAEPILVFVVCAILWSIALRLVLLFLGHQHG